MVKCTCYCKTYSFKLVSIFWTYAYRSVSGRFQLLPLPCVRGKPTAAALDLQLCCLLPVRQWRKTPSESRTKQVYQCWVAAASQLLEWADDRNSVKLPCWMLMQKPRVSWFQETNVLSGPDWLWRRQLHPLPSSSPSYMWAITTLSRLRSAIFTYLQFLTMCNRCQKFHMNEKNCNKHL